MQKYRGRLSSASHSVGIEKQCNTDFCQFRCQNRPWILPTCEAEIGGYYVRIFSGSGPYAVRLGGCSPDSEIGVLRMKDLPSVIVLFELMRGTDKAQFDLRKYRNESWQVAIDRTGNFDYKMGWGKKRNCEPHIDAMQRL